MKDQFVTTSLDNNNLSDSTSTSSSIDKVKPATLVELNGQETAGLKQLRLLIDGSTKLRSYTLPDELLVKFLRSRDFNVKKSSILLKGYISYIQTKANLFTWSDEVSSVIRSMIYYPYQHRGPNGEVIVGMEIGKWDYNKIKFESIIQTSLFVQEVALLEKSVQQAGFTFLVDMRNVSLRQIYQMGVTNAMILATLTDNCMPIKTLNIHICFENRITNFAYSMFRPFLSEELKQRVLFHGNDMNTTLFKILPSEYIPPNWHGTNEEPKLDNIINTIQNKAPQIVKKWESFRNGNGRVDFGDFNGYDGFDQLDLNVDGCDGGANNNDDCGADE